MKEIIKRIREEKGGFTLAELLIVVAIILVLVAIAVPIFTANLDQAGKAVTTANMRTVKSEAAAKYLTSDAVKTGTAETYFIEITDKGDVKAATAAGDNIYEATVTMDKDTKDATVVVKAPANVPQP